MSCKTSPTSLATFGLATLLAAPALSDTVLATDNGIINDSLCVGFSCANPETFWSDSEIVIKDVNTRLRFDDNSDSASSFPDTDWTLQANDTISNGADQFMLMDATAGTTPLAVSGGAPSNSLFIGAGGEIGMGTMLPQADLHIASGSVTFRMEQTSFNPIAWEQYIDPPGNFYIYNTTALTSPFIIAPDAPDYALYLGANGTGIGTVSPQAKLHVQSAAGDAKILIEETTGTTSPRTLLNLQNNGRPEIVMGNTGTGGEWSFGAGTKFILKQGAVGSASSAKTKLFEIDASGNATLAGSLTTGGPSCAGGCDAVFDPDYDLPSITDHAAQMYALGHLPNVGPTRPGAAMNVSDKLGRVLNEVEHAHIYIARLEQTVRGQHSEMAALKADQAARIATLEARLDALAATPRP